MATSLDFADGQLVSDRTTLAVRVGRKRSRVAWGDVRRVWVREGRAFRYPSLGAAFGAALLLPSAWLIITSIQVVGGVVGLVNRAGIAAAAGVGFGAWVLWDVVRSPRVCWVGVETPSGRQEWPVAGVGPQELGTWLEQARAQAEQAS